MISFDPENRNMQHVYRTCAAHDHVSDQRYYIGLFILFYAVFNNGIAIMTVHSGSKKHLCRRQNAVLTLQKLVNSHLPNDIVFSIESPVMDHLADSFVRIINNDRFLGIVAAEIESLCDSGK